MPTRTVHTLVRSPDLDTHPRQAGTPPSRPQRDHAKPPVQYWQPGDPAREERHHGSPHVCRAPPAPLGSSNMTGGPLHSLHPADPPCGGQAAYRNASSRLPTSLVNEPTLRRPGSSLTRRGGLHSTPQPTRSARDDHSAKSSPPASITASRRSSSTSRVTRATTSAEKPRRASAPASRR